MEHPDNELKVGARRIAAGLEWTLYKNQYGIAWKAGPLGHNIKADEKGYRLEDRLVKFATFEKAAIAAVDLRASDVKKARELVAAFDAEMLRGA